MEFEELNQLIDGMNAIATVNRACYNAHISQGFLPPEALHLTAEGMKVFFEAMMKQVAGSAPQGPPQ